MASKPRPSIIRLLPSTIPISIKDRASGIRAIPRRANIAIPANKINPCGPEVSRPNANANTPIAAMATIAAKMLPTFIFPNIENAKPIGINATPRRANINAPFKTSEANLPINIAVVPTATMARVAASNPAIGESANIFIPKANGITAAPTAASPSAPLRIPPFPNDFTPCARDVRNPPKPLPPPPGIFGIAGVGGKPPPSLGVNIDFTPL